MGFKSSSLFCTVLLAIFVSAHAEDERIDESNDTLDLNRTSDAALEQMLKDLQDLDLSYDNTAHGQLLDDGLNILIDKIFSFTDSLRPTEQAMQHPDLFSHKLRSINERREYADLVLSEEKLADLKSKFTIVQKEFVLRLKILTGSMYDYKFEIEIYLNRSSDDNNLVQWDKSSYSRDLERLRREKENIKKWEKEVVEAFEAEKAKRDV